MYFTIIAHLNSDWPHFKCSGAMWVGCLPILPGNKALAHSLLFPNRESLPSEFHSEYFRIVRHLKSHVVHTLILQMKEMITVQTDESQLVSELEFMNST